MDNKNIKESYVFATEQERLLGRVVVTHEGYRLNEGDLFILATTAKVYYHPKNVYVYDVSTRKFRGRYNIAWFEILGVFESEEKLLQSLGEDQGNEPFEKEIYKEPINVGSPVLEQLSLFDI